MKIFITISLFVILAKSQICKNNCMEGPLSLPYYFCQCPLIPNPLLSSCVRHCLDDTLCRFCDGDRLLGIPKLCPYTTNSNIDLSTTDFGLILKAGTQVFGLHQGTSTNKTYFDPVILSGFISIFYKTLKIKAEYEVNGTICEGTPINKKGYVTISFDDITLDWQPQVLFLTKCGYIFIYVGETSTYVQLNTAKRITFNFEDYEKQTDTVMTECLKYKWIEFFEKIRPKLQSFFLELCIAFANNIILQVPFNEVLTVTPIPLPIFNGLTI